MAIEYEQTIKDRFPNLEYSEFKSVNNHQERLGIDDLSFSMPEKKQMILDSMETLTLSCKGFVYFYSTDYLSRSLNNRLDNILVRLDPERTVLIFIGNAAQDVKRLTRPEVFKFFATLDLNVKRISERGSTSGKVSVLTGKNEVRERITKKITSLVLLDDVLLNGTTAQAAKCFIDKDNELDWYAATWMTLSPTQSQYRRSPDIFASGLPGFRKVATTVLYQGKTGIPTNNSLSTFAGTNEKSQTVVREYLDRYMQDKEGFDQAITELRRIKNE